MGNSSPAHGNRIIGRAKDKVTVTRVSNVFAGLNPDGLFIKENLVKIRMKIKKSVY